jgi:hypothetical protein
MIRFRTLLCAASAACGLTLGFGVQAQTQITLSLPTGTSCTFANNTLNCTGSGAGVASCSINGQTTAVIGDTVTLTGSCVTASGAPDTGAWTGCGTSTASTCTITSSATVTLAGSAGGSKSKTVTFGAATCSISPQNPTVITGNSQTFSASCNFTPTTYSWTGCTSSQASCTLTPAAGGAVGVTASNGTSTASASTNYTVGTGAGAGVPTKCDDGDSSVSASAITQINGLPIKVSITNSQTAVFPIVVPAGVSKFTVPLVQTGDGSDRVPKSVWISKRPCFTPPASAAAASPLAGTTLAEGLIGYKVTTASWNFFVGSTSNVFYGGGFININVMPGDTWYMMVEWYSAKGGGCLSSSGCNVTVTPSLLN